MHYYQNNTQSANVHGENILESLKSDDVSQIGNHFGSV